ncbi:MAG: peptidase C1 [Ignavibacteriales bacterium]|nr:peptidase C1 [Ignavibacteriales bacterium]
MKKFKVLLLLFIVSGFAFAQVHNKGTFIQPKSEFWDEVQKGINDFNKKEKPDNKIFKMDFTGLNLPKSKNEFTSYWHNDPVNQGSTGTCWSFSTTSYLESEVYRIHNKKIKLSEIWTAYWEYLAKVKRFVTERGNSAIGEGSQANAVIRIWKEYGIVPESVYDGKLAGQKHHDHSKMFQEINNYLIGIKNTNSWNEDEVVSTVKSILNHYLGEPPTKVMVDGKEYTPKEYLNKIVGLNIDDYVAVMSLMQKPYYEKAEYEVPDNWWHNKDYYNVPLDVFMSTIKSTIRKGFTLAIFGDVSEAGIESHAKVAMIPSFDVPSEYIDESARQFRFSNGTTGDDHGIHMVGYLNKDGKDWYLIKDSGSGSFNVGDKGYYFYQEDYVKLKMLGFMAHKDAVADLLSKFKK